MSNRGKFVGPMGLQISEDRLRERFEVFNEIGATERGGVNRPALSVANREARDCLVDWFEAAELSVSVDEVGNIFGRRPGRQSLPPVLVGSHVDSQYNGGRFDGVIGVLGSLEVVETLDDAGIETERPIEIVSWSNEEGARFQPGTLGSGVFASVFDRDEAYELTDKQGLRFGDELERIGYKGPTPCAPRALHSYLELHVEQGPNLEEAGIPVGIVDGIVGYRWLRATFEGQADHAGPTPMDSRRDALVAASDVVRVVRRIAASDDGDLVGTVGSVDVHPNSINVIPERVELTVDLRSYDDDRIERAANEVIRAIGAAAEQEGVEWEHEELMRNGAQTFADPCVQAVEQAAEDLGIEYRHMVSGAGHDASHLNQLCATGMIFVPSVGGVSHTEDEFTEWADLVTGTNVLLRAARARANDPT